MIKKFHITAINEKYTWDFDQCDTAEEAYNSECEAILEHGADSVRVSLKTEAHIHTVHKEDLELKRKMN